MSMRTIAAKTAVEICKAANSKQIIPMHYKTDTSGYSELTKVDEFLDLAEEAGLRDKTIVM